MTISKYPGILHPTNDNLLRVAEQLKESVEIAQRLRGAEGDSFVRYSEYDALRVRIDTLEGDIGWDDLRFPATGISIGGFTNPPDTQTDTGLLLFDGATTAETVGVLAQMPHTWRVGTEVHPHVHWAKTSDAAGDVYWTMRYKWFGFGEVQPSWSSLVAATDVQASDATQKQMISSFPAISGTDKDISSLLMIQIGRDPTDASDDYAADAVLYEFDIHYRADSKGSASEYRK